MKRFLDDIFFPSLIENNIDTVIPSIERPLTSKKMSENVGITKWDAEFIDTIEYKYLNEMITAADYLGIESLLDLASAKVASLMKGEQPEIRKQIINGTWML